MTNKLFTTIIILELIIGSLALGYIFSAYWFKPLGPSMELPAVASAQLQNSPQTVSVDTQNTETFSQPTETPSSSFMDQIASLIKPAAESKKSLCGGPPVMTILVVGSDERQSGYLYGLADSIRIFRIDFSTPKVMVLDIPRDLWVDIPAIQDHYGITQGKINQAYFFGNPGMGYYDGPGEGPGLLALTLNQNYGLQLDHYIAMDRKTFVSMIDAIGGIDVELNSLIDMNQNQDGAHPDLVLDAGVHHLDGDMALRLASDRIPSIFQRARYQNIVLKSLQEKLLNPSMLPQLPELVTQFVGSVQTDLSPNDIKQLICVGKSLTQRNTEIVAFPDEMFVPGSTYDPYRQVNTYTLSVDIDRFREYMLEFMNGTWPDDQGLSQ
jgi:LCP family protein required for cell wall assembly